ncbi:hypothetical protein Ancab_025749 [Ancistrocladus abbreviatus]
MYKCKDEHLGFINLSGYLIFHNLASGARTAELKDLSIQASHGDSWRLWHLTSVGTTGRSPKVSWSKQHSAPTDGVSFSPSNDKIFASVGLDEKLCTSNSGMRKHLFCIAYEAPFSSLAFRDDAWILAAGTSNGRMHLPLFYSTCSSTFEIRSHNKDEGQQEEDALFMCMGVSLFVKHVDLSTKSWGPIMVSKGMAGILHIAYLDSANSKLKLVWRTLNANVLCSPGVALKKVSLLLVDCRIVYARHYSNLGSSQCEV